MFHYSKVIAHTKPSTPGRDSFFQPIFSEPFVVPYTRLLSLHIGGHTGSHGPSFDPQQVPSISIHQHGRRVILAEPRKRILWTEGLGPSDYPLLQHLGLQTRSIIALIHKANHIADQSEASSYLAEGKAIPMLENVRAWVWGCGWCFGGVSY